MGSVDLSQGQGTAYISANHIPRTVQCTVRVHGGGGVQHSTRGLEEQCWGAQTYCFTDPERHPAVLEDPGPPDAEAAAAAAVLVRVRPLLPEVVEVLRPVPGLVTKQSGNVFRVGTFLDFASLSTRTEGPHWGARADERAKSNSTCR